jgi:hypothetical protein
LALNLLIHFDGQLLVVVERSQRLPEARRRWAVANALPYVARCVMERPWKLHFGWDHLLSKGVFRLNAGSLDRGEPEPNAPVPAKAPESNEAAF